MPAELLDYFGAEKNESLLFVGVALAATVASVWMWKSGSVHRGMGYPLVAVGLIQLVVGGSVYLRTDRQVAALEAQLAQDPAAFQAAEGKRMATVSANFRLYKAIEIALWLAGVAMTYLWKDRERLYSVGVGLILQASIMLVLDLFAERRADTYISALTKLRN
jgi:hypothetical protein